MKVLLLDDHPLIQAALQNIIHTLDDSIAVLTADHPDEAFALLAQDASVELVLLDLMLGDGVDGFAVLAALREGYPALPVVVVSATERLTDMVRAIDMGAMGFVPKRSPSRELFEAVALVLAGGVFIPPALLGLIRMPGMKLAEAAAAADAESAARAANALRRASAASAGTMGNVTTAVMRPMVDVGADMSNAQPESPLVEAPATLAPAALTGPQAPASMAALGLTPRQSSVLQLLLKGLPNKLIARELNVSVDTVKDHVAAVLRALGVNSRTQAVLVVSRITQQAQGGVLAAHLI